MQTTFVLVAVVAALLRFIWTLPLTDSHRSYLFERHPGDQGESTAGDECSKEIRSIISKRTTMLQKQHSSAEERTISDSEIEAFRRDGSVLLREALPEEWVRILRYLLMDVFHRPTNWDILYSRLVANFYGAQKSIFLHHSSDCGREFIKYSPIAKLVSDLAGRNATLRICEPTEALINYDQTSKTKSSQGHTAWHRDDVYMPVTSKYGSTGTGTNDSPAIVRLWMPLMQISTTDQMKFLMLNNSKPARDGRMAENLDVEGTNFAHHSKMMESSTFTSEIIDPRIYYPGDAFAFQGDTPHFAQNLNCSLEGCARMILSFCVDENAVFDSTKKTSLIPFTSSTENGQRLSGTAFPQVHPWNATDWLSLWKPTYGDVISSIVDAIWAGSGAFIGLDVKTCIAYVARVSRCVVDSVWAKPLIDMETGRVVNADCLKGADGGET